MKRFRRVLLGDILKIRKTPFFLLHVALPLVGIGVFAAYQWMTNTHSQLLLINYFQVLSLVYPILAAWMTTLIVDQESEAGDSFFLLSAVSRWRVLTSKVGILLVSGLFACLLAGFGYHLVVQFREDYALSSLFILFLVGIVWCSTLFLYFFHLFLGLSFGRNVNFAVAAVELLLSALLLTGLGETIWFFFPCAWGVRSIPLAAAYLRGATATSFGTVHVVLVCLVLLTVFMLGGLFLWFQKWEGRSSEE